MKNAVVRYVVWRRSEAPLPAEGGTSGGLTPGSQMVLQDGTAWTFAGEVPAAGLENYSAVVPTLFDSTKTGGMHWSVFFVSGHTETGNLVYRTEPDSGYSVDNLAPEPPAEVLAQETDAGIQLQWTDPVDADFKYFSIYRSEQPGVQPTPQNRIASTTETSYLDADVTVGKTYYYTITATDFSGNEGVPAPEVALVVTGVEEAVQAGIPAEYALLQNYPNPFNPSTSIRFNLKAPGHVDLAIYNLLGDRVKQILDRDMPAGYHRVVIDASGLASGVYFYKLRVNDFVAVRKMVVAR